jgi:GNAT superfamily N-acetyltransferase
MYRPASLDLRRSRPVWSIRPARSRADWEQAAVLLHEHAEWIRLAAGIDLAVEQPGFADELASLSAHYDGTQGALFLADGGGAAVGLVAVRGQDDASAELKRMYVRPVARGQGIADRLVGAVLDFAAARGWRSIWLETMVGVMDPAVSVYRRNGFDQTSEQGRNLVLDGVVVMERPVARRLCSA